MAKPFDDTLKHLVEANPSDWLDYLGITGQSVEVIDADLSTLTTLSDKIIKVHAPLPFLLHLEFQAGDPTGLGERTLFQDVALRHRHNIAVYSVVLLLRKKADSPKVTGLVRYADPVDGGLTLEYRYRVIRVWELPVEAVLSGPVTVLPLAPLCAVKRTDLPAVIARMKHRFTEEVSTNAAKELWSATYLLMGLKYAAAFTQQLLKGVQGMEESTTYQEIIRIGKNEGRIEGKAEGKAEGVREVLMLQGKVRFGKPTSKTEAALAGIHSVERLEQLAERLLTVESWDDLLAQ